MNSNTKVGGFAIDLATQGPPNSRFEQKIFLGKEVYKFVKKALFNA